MMDSWTRCSGAGIPTRWALSNTAVCTVGEGKHRVAMSCKSSLCLRCAKVYVDNWVSQVSQMLHEGVIYRHIVLTVPAMLRKTFYQQCQSGVESVHALWGAGAWMMSSAGSVAASQGRLHRGHPDAWPQWPVQPPSAHHRHQWRLGSAGQAVGASGLYAISHAAQEVAVASADDAPTDGEDARRSSGWWIRVTRAIARGLSTNVQKGDVPRTVSEFGDATWPNMW